MTRIPGYIFPEISVKNVLASRTTAVGSRFHRYFSTCSDYTATFLLYWQFCQLLMTWGMPRYDKQASQICRPTQRRAEVSALCPIIIEASFTSQNNVWYRPAGCHFSTIPSFCNFSFQSWIFQVLQSSFKPSTYAMVLALLHMKKCYKIELWQLKKLKHFCIPSLAILCNRNYMQRLPSHSHCIVLNWQYL